MTEFNDLQTIKRNLFAMRNGVIAEALRRAGSPFRIIFGVNLPQLNEIAETHGKDAALARKLWNNTTTRESMLIAPMLLKPAEITEDEAVEMAGGCPSAEVSDVLCHSLLRRMPHAFDLAERLAGAADSMSRYAAMRLLWHFIASQPERCLALAKKEIERADPLTLSPARQIADEIAFLSEE